ncbi:MAG: NAD(P)/FAD-dependent oxidoreductase [Oscillospiraceae bacterium]|nr:NAD(P)/FAD-dependent oxidoreductase [Oscillospiraceae bacterium]
MPNRIDVTVIGAGPAGLAAAISASRNGASVLLVEREARLGGILKQCIHDGFGVLRYREKLSGPEYAYRDIVELETTNARVMLQTYVSRIEKIGSKFILTLISSNGLIQVESGSIVLATGCRERTAKQVAIHGTRPAGVFTAGTAQYYTNILGQMPTKRCIILGSGDIGLIMARRLTLEGAEVLGVYEAKSEPGGLLRNVLQCLNDFEIPLRLEHTVTRLFGTDRLKAVEICRVDKNMTPIPGTEKLVKCDALILSVGLVPENELAEMLGAELNNKTLGPVCDQNNMTTVSGVFTCGNSTHVNDLVEFVSESGVIAGSNAARYNYRAARSLVPISSSADFLYVVPQCIDVGSQENEATIYFRSSEVRKNVTVSVLADGQEVFKQHYNHLRPPEMERIEVYFGGEFQRMSKVTLRMEDTVISEEEPEEEDAQSVETVGAQEDLGYVDDSEHMEYDDDFADVGDYGDIDDTEDIR